MTHKERKQYLLSDIRWAFNNTNNSSKKITLSNYYDTVNDQPVDKIDYAWYYNMMESFGFKFA